MIKQKGRRKQSRFRGGGSPLFRALSRDSYDLNGEADGGWWGS